MIDTKHFLKMHFHFIVHGMSGVFFWILVFTVLCHADEEQPSDDADQDHCIG